MSQTFGQMLSDYKAKQQKVQEFTFGQMLADYKSREAERQEMLREMFRPRNEIDVIEDTLRDAEADRQRQTQEQQAIEQQEEKEPEIESYVKRRGYSHMATPEEMDYFTKTLGRAIKRGLFETLGSLFGTSLKYIGGKLQEEDPLGFKVSPEFERPYVKPEIVLQLGKTLEIAGAQTHEYFEKKAEKIEEPEELEGKTLWDNPELMRNATWWAWNVGKMIPSFGAALIPGIGTAKFIQIFGTKIPFTAQTIPRLARFAPQLVGGTVGGFLEGASTYEEIIKLGGTREEAESALELMTLASGGLNALSLGQMLKKMPDGYKKAVIQYLTTGSMEGLTEWAEEPAEGLIKHGLGYATLEDVWEQTKRGIDVVPPAFLMGVGGTAAVTALTKEKEAIEEEPPVVEPEKPAVEKKEAEAVVVPPEEEVTAEAEKEEEITAETLRRKEEVAEKPAKVPEIEKPWLFTLHGYLKEIRKTVDINEETGRNIHREEVKKAISEGKKFPLEVLEDYPELKEMAISAKITEVEEIVERKPEEKVKEIITKEPVVTGKKGTARTEAGTEIGFDYVIFDQKDIIASHDINLKPNKEYPAEKQPRDRTKVASMIQVQKIERDLIPERLGENVMASEGAPIVDFAGIVESGNARIIALQRLYKSGNAETYKQFLIENADKFGLDVEAIRGMESPIMVRRRITDVDVRKFIEEANVPTTAVLSATEQAMSDSKKLTTSLLGKFVPNEAGNINTPANRDFRRGFFKNVIGETELGRYIDKRGNVSQEGLNRIRNAIFAKAYGEVSAIERLAESSDNNIRNITNAMLYIAPNISILSQQIKEGARYDFDISKDMADAAEKLSNLRSEGRHIEDYLKQKDLFEQTDISQLSKMILSAFENNKRSTKKIVEIFDKYIKLVEGIGDPKQKGLFKRTIPSKAELFESALEVSDAEISIQPSIFEEPAVGREKISELPEEVRRKREEKPAEVKPAEKPSLKKPAAELKAGIKESLKALKELAKDPNIGLRIEDVNYESGYKKAKPHIDAAWAHYKAAGKGIAEFVRDMIKELGAKFKPHLERWREDMELAEGKSTNRQKARIHILKKDLNWSDERYRVEMAELYGKETSTELTYEQANKFAEHLAGILRKSIIREKIYEEAGEKSKAVLYKRKKDLKNAEQGIIAEHIFLISSELELIHPKLKSALRRHIDNVNMAVKRDMEGVYPLLKSTKKMNKKDFAVFDLAQKNGDHEKVNEIVEKYGIQSEIEQARGILDGIYERARKVGYDVNYLPNYFPRILKDKNGFLDYLYDTDAWGLIEESIKEKEKTIGRTLSQDEIIRIANNVIRGYGGKITLAKPKGLKERRIEIIDNELNQFYHDTNVSLLMYIEETNRAIETRKFFGKTAKKKVEEEGEMVEVYGLKNDDPNIDDLDESIGKYVTDFIKENEISPAQSNKIIGLIRSYFNYRYSSGFIQTMKNLGYLTTLNDIGNTITQLGDLTYAYYNAGFYSATKALGKAIVGKSEITRKDQGIEYIAQEFANPKLLGRLLEKQFKYIGFTKIDNLGKETLMNGTIDRFRRTARKGTISPFHMKKLKHMFEGETEQVIKDLKSGKLTENIRYLAFNTLLDFQPVARSEVPKKYLDAPNGRIAYSLKTFQIKHLDIIRREIIWGIKYGTKQEKIAAYKRAIRLAGLFLLANMGADEIRDFIYGRTTTISERVVDNLLRLFGLSRYITWYGARHGLTKAAIRLLLPPYPYLEYPEKDITYAIKKAISGEWEDFQIKDIASVRLFMFGKMYYYWFGKGREYIEEEKAEKEREKFIDEELRKRGLERGR